MELPAQRQQLINFISALSTLLTDPWRCSNVSLTLRPTAGAFYVMFTKDENAWGGDISSRVIVAIDSVRAARHVSLNVDYVVRKQAVIAGDSAIDARLVGTNEHVAVASIDDADPSTLDEIYNMFVDHVQSHMCTEIRIAVAWC